METEAYAKEIKAGAKATGQRTGQYLFNHLTHGASNAVRGTMFDPFHRDWDIYQIVEWVDNHLIFDADNDIIAVFNNNQILWEDKP